VAWEGGEDEARLGRLREGAGDDRRVCDIISAGGRSRGLEWSGGWRERVKEGEKEEGGGGWGSLLPIE